MCEWFDETCGELLDHLDARSLRENTIVIYICDNGWAPASTNADDPNQKRWRDYAIRSKSSPYDGGIRTPIMICWPGRVQGGEAKELAQSIDLFPTLAKACGADAPDDLPGIDLLDAQARAKRTAIFGAVHSTHNMTVQNPDDALQYRWCIEGDWKLIVRHHGVDTTGYRVLHTWDVEPVRLYNLAADPHETTNLAAGNDDRLRSLRAKIDAWHPIVPGG
jgi:arylsulfatase A-like enzyme